MTPPQDKQITLSQIRSFVETARRGSFTAAAEVLDLSQPTIWKQVHELERLLNVTLIRPNHRGCELTHEGTILEKLAAPSIANLINLPSRFHEAVENATVLISIAGTPRPLSEEIVPSIADFTLRFPRSRFNLIETLAEQIPRFVDEGSAEIGFTLDCQSARALFPSLLVEPWYPLDVMLVMHRKHPLNNKRKLALRDLKPYPLIGTQAMFSELPGSEQILALGLDQNPANCVEARHSSVVRSCVRHRLGVALLLGRDGQSRHPDLIERNMTHCLGQATMYLVHRAGVVHSPLVMEFASTLRVLK